MNETRLPSISRLHAEAMERIKSQAAGRGPEGFAAIMLGARDLAIADVCAALLYDLRPVRSEKDKDDGR